MLKVKDLRDKLNRYPSETEVKINLIVQNDCGTEIEKTEESIYDIEFHDNLENDDNYLYLTTIYTMPEYEEDD